MPATVTITEQGDADALLARLPLVLRGKVLKQALRQAGRVVLGPAAQKLQAPGYRGDKPGKIALRDTLTVLVRDYGERQLAVVGAQFPAGAHAHLVEFGHELVIGGKSRGRVQPYPFLRPAADQTRGAQQQAISQTIQRGIENEAKKGQ